MTLGFSQQAAAAIACHLAVAQVEAWLELDSPPAQADFWAKLCVHLPDLQALHAQDRLKRQDAQAQPAHRRTVEPSDALSALQDALQKVGGRLCPRLREPGQPYLTPNEQNLIVASALLTLADLRNACSHSAFLSKPFEPALAEGRPPALGPLDLGEQTALRHWLEHLYREAVTSLKVTRAPALWESDATQSAPGWLAGRDAADARRHWELSIGAGLPFFLSLFLTRSNSHWLAQQLAGATHKHGRRTLRLLSYHSWGDGTSQLAVADPDEDLVREVLASVSVPPLASHAGQEAQKAAQQRAEPGAAALPGDVDELAGLARDLVPYRREPKTRQYVMRMLDRMDLLPGLQFWGRWSRNVGTAEEARWEPDAELQPSMAQPDKRKRVFKESYGRNSASAVAAQGGPAHIRFEYDWSDGNVRFALRHHHQAACGVMRWRDFLNWVFVAAIERGDDASVHEQLCHWAFEHLRQRQALLQDSLQGTVAEGAETAPDAPALRLLPRQLRLHLLGQSPDLRQRVAARLRFWQDQRLPWLNRAFEPNRRWQVARRDAKRAGKAPNAVPMPDDLMPTSVQAHEVLHHMLAVLSPAERGQFSRYKFQALYARLLDYKAEPQAFWEQLRGFCPEHPHLRWEMPTRVNLQFPDNRRSLHELMQAVLDEKAQWLNEALLAQDSASEAQLNALASRWGVGLGLAVGSPAVGPRGSVPGGQDHAGDSAPASAAGWRAAASRALHYTVLPAGFVQNALHRPDAPPSRVRATPVHATDTRQARARNGAQRIRDWPSRLQLFPEFYQPELLPPWRALAQGIAARCQAGAEQPLSEAAQDLWPDPQERQLRKAQWRALVGELNDWHTEDKVCLLLAEKLAARTLLQFTPGARVDCALADPVLRSLPVPGGVPVRIAFKHPLQARRQRAWGQPANLVRAIVHNYPQAQGPQAAPLAGEQVQQLLQHYRSRNVLLVERLLQLELAAVSHRWLNKGEARAGRKRVYWPFDKVVQQLHLNAPDLLGADDAQTLLKLRHWALHDSVPPVDQTDELALYYGAAREGDLRVKKLGEHQLKLIHDLLKGPLRRPAVA